MARKSRTTSTTTSIKRQKRARSSIPEPFQLISSATVAGGPQKVRVPKLVLSGAWLKAAGFPIGSAAYLTTDTRGELALHRLGLGVPRRLVIRSAPR
jgi:hypothetical protein